MKDDFLCLFVLLLFVSCRDEDVNTSLNEEEITQFDFFIEGMVNDLKSDFEQTNIDNVNTSNTYFSHYQSTWFEAYKNGSDSQAGYWTIRIVDLDILNIEIPFGDWTTSEAFISWKDDEVVPIDDERCGFVDGRCAYSGSTSDGLIFTITSHDNTILSGTFSGRLYLTGIEFNAFQDKSNFDEVTKAAFRINYRIDHNE